jgi:immune inhibitor A
MPAISLQSCKVFFSSNQDPVDPISKKGGTELLYRYLVFPEPDFTPIGGNEMRVKKLFILMATLLAGFAMVIGLIRMIHASPVSFAAKLQVTDPVAQSVPKGSLSPERLQHYDNLLLKLIRTQPYLIAPREDTVLREVILALGKDASQAQIQAAVDQYYKDFHEGNNKVSRPNPLARLGREKQLEIAAQKQAQGIDVSTELTGTPKLLTVMLTFTGTQTFTTSDPVLFNGACLTDTTVYPPTYTIVVNGPGFNEVPQPTDNWTAWLDPNDSYTGGFTKAFFEKLMFSTTGYTQTMRPELDNPWTGGKGFDFSGVSFRNYYAENSRGVYIPTGEVVNVNVPEAVSFFGAAACHTRIQDDSYFGRPDYTIAISAAQQINAQIPAFDWTAFDQEDVYDYDNDGDFNEPDGYVDHFFLIEPSNHEGAPYNEFLVWPHSWDVRAGTPNGPVGNQLGGYKVSDAGPLGGVWVLNYTISDEVSGLGVFVHEYGHDIGLPDNYDVSGNGYSNAGFWDLMDSGNFGGALSGMHPVNMTIWDKSEPYLGWNDPVEIDLSTTPAVGEENALEFTLGQQSRPPAGTVDGLRIKLPDIETVASVTPYGSMMWYSDQGDDRSESIAQGFTPASGENITVTAQLAYSTEEDWDYMYWEISSTAASDWTPIPVYSGTTEITTDTNPHGNNPSGNGITGSSGGWITAHAVITPGMLGAGPVEFRFRYFCDAGVQEEGIFLDNIDISGSTSGQIFYDDAESGDTWTHMSEGLNKDKPWRIYNGITLVEQSYLVEWRNSGEGTGFNGVDEKQAFETAGFDIGLNRMYWIDELDELGNIAHIDRFSEHTPGMLIWRTDGRYSNNTGGAFLFDGPSLGNKGRVQIVDANPDPFFVTDEVLGPRRVTERRSSFDGTFGLRDRPAMELSSNYYQTPTDTLTTIPGAPAQPVFRDRIGDNPGVSGTPPNAFFIDSRAGVVLPSVNNVPYATYWDVYGDLGNPGLNAYGINLQVVSQAEDGTWGKVKFWLDDDTVFVDKRASAASIPSSMTVTYTLTLKDASGSRYSDSHNHLFPSVMFEPLPAGASLVSVHLDGTGSVFTSTAAMAAAGIDPARIPSSALMDQASGNQILWVGNLGGHRLGEPDAVITYAVRYAPGCYTNTTTLYVNQQMITDDFRNGGSPFLWPKHNQYSASTPRICSPTIYFPVVVH